jgi:hypothetical protein
LSREPLANPKNATPCGTGVLDIALVSGRMRIVNRDVVCNLLGECLQDVSSAMFTMPYCFVCYWAFNFSLFLYWAIKLTKAAEAIIAEDSGVSLCQQLQGSKQRTPS